MTKLRPHRVLGMIDEGRQIHALALTEGEFAGIVFSYKDVSFEEDPENDVLKLKYSFDIHEVPEEKADYDEKSLQNTLGDFLLELLYYGLERDKLGFIDDKQD